MAVTRETGAVGSPARSGTGLPPLELRVDPTATLRMALAILLTLDVLMVYLDVVVTYYEAVEHEAILDLCNLVLEGSLGGWYSSAQTLLVGLLVLTIGWVTSAGAGDSRSSWAWRVAALFFVYMAVDDGSALHEALATAAEDAAHESLAAGHPSVLGQLFGAFPSYPWQVLFLPVLGSLGAFVAWWSWRAMPRRTSRALLVAGLACFVAAVCLDFVEGMETPYENLTRILAWRDDAIPHFSGVLEEFLEMLGTSLFAYAYLQHLLLLVANVRTHLKQEAPE